MGRTKKPLPPGGGPAADFARELRTARADAGNPTYKAMARRSRYSRQAMSGADGGDHLPTWDLTRGYLTSIRIVTTDDVDLWHKKWTTANDELAATRAGRPPAKHDR